MSGISTRDSLMRVMKACCIFDLLGFAPPQTAI